MEHRQLEYLLAVADTGSFTAAAAQLQVAQSAISAGVRRLEKNLDVELLARTTHRVELTEAGRALLPHARAMLAAASAGRHALEEVRGDLRGGVTFVAMTTSVVLDVLEVLDGFRARHPHVRIAIAPNPPAPLDVLDDLRDGGVDFSLMGWGTGRTPGIRTERLHIGPVSLAVAPGHPLAAASSIELADLSALTLVMPSWPAIMNLVVDRALSAAGIEVDPHYRADNPVRLVQFVKLGMACALLPRLTIEANQPGLVEVPIRGEAPQFALVVATAEGRPLSGPARALVDELFARTTRWREPVTTTGRP